MKLIIQYDDLIQNDIISDVSIEDFQDGILYQQEYDTVYTQIDTQQYQQDMDWSIPSQDILGDFQN